MWTIFLPFQVSDGRMTRALNKVNTGEPPGDDINEARKFLPAKLPTKKWN